MMCALPLVGRLLLCVREQPGRKLRMPGVEADQGPVDAQERLLGQILGVVLCKSQQPQEAEQGPLVAQHQQPERLAVPAEDLPDQEFVIHGVDQSYRPGPAKVPYVQTVLEFLDFMALAAPPGRGATIARWCSDRRGRPWRCRWPHPPGLDDINSGPRACPILSDQVRRYP